VSNRRTSLPLLQAPRGAYDVVNEQQFRTVIETRLKALERSTDPGGTSSSSLTFQQAGTGSVVRTLQGKVREIVSVLDYIPEFLHAGILDRTNTTDLTTYIQAALDTGYDVFFPRGTYKTTDVIVQKLDGQRVFGSNKYNTIVTNTTTSAALWQLGSTGGAGNRGQFCGLDNLRLIGNATTTEGLSLFGIVDDGGSGAARSCKVTSVHIADVGAGFGLRVSSWENELHDIEVFTCDKGLRLGAECNSCTFTIYISDCTNEGIVNDATAGTPAGVHFITATVQYCGGTDGSIDLRDIFGIKFSNLYLEGCAAPANVYMTTGCKAPEFDIVEHNLATGTATKVIVATDVKGLVVQSVDTRGGAMASLVEVNGTLPTGYVGVLTVSAGSVTSVYVDNSTRKSVNYVNSLDVRLSPTRITNAADSASVEVASIEGYRATPTDNDSAYLSFRLANDAATPERIEYGRMSGNAVDVSDGTEDGRLLWGVMTGGSFANELELTGTALSPFSTGGLDLGTSSKLYGASYLTSIELGHASDTTISRDSSGVIAVEGVPLYSGIPQNSKSTDYTLVLSDAQKHIYHPASDDNPRTFTIPANSSVAYPIGTVITFLNRINTVTIAITTDTLVWAEDGSTGSRTLAAAGLATAIKDTSTSWVISGAGLS
jgi:hypothetical protein